MKTRFLFTTLLFLAGSTLGSPTYTLIKSQTLADLDYSDLWALEDQYGEDNVVVGEPLLPLYINSYGAVPTKLSNGQTTIKDIWTIDSAGVAGTSVYTSGINDQIIRTGEYDLQNTTYKPTEDGLYRLLASMSVASCLDVADESGASNIEASWRIKLVRNLLTPAEQKGGLKAINRPLAFEGTINGVKISLKVDPGAKGFKGHLKISTDLTPGPPAWTRYCTFDKMTKVDLYK